MSSSPKVTIIAVCYNDETRLPAFLNSLRSLQYPAYQLVFVDNASQDSSVGYMQTNYPAGHIVQVGANLGTTGGYNRGTQVAAALGAHYFFMWSIDCLLPPDCIQRLVEIAESDTNIAVVQPVLLDSCSENTVDMFGGTFDLMTGYIALNSRGQPVESLPEMTEPDWVGSGLALIRRSAFEQVGGFDEQLFMYGEDVDLSLRLRQQGYRIVATSRTCAWHRHAELSRGRAPTPLQMFYVERSRIHAVKKYGRPGVWRRVAVWQMRKGLWLTARLLWRREPRSAVAYWLGIWYGMTSRMGKRLFVE